MGREQAVVIGQCSLRLVAVEAQRTQVQQQLGLVGCDAQGRFPGLAPGSQLPQLHLQAAQQEQRVNIARLVRQRDPASLDGAHNVAAPGPLARLCQVGSYHVHLSR
jgi:hypothetical protein